VAADSNISVEDEMTAFQLIDISPATLPAAPRASSGFPAGFRSQSFLTDQERIAVSDRLELRIWEAAIDGLFASNGQRETVLSVHVSNAGTIEIPYAGQLTVAGLTASQAREIILNRYQGQAIDPEVNIQIIETGARAATVIGATRTSGRATIPANGLRLLDLIAQMGGVPYPYWEVDILVSRGSTTGRMRMDHLRGNASNNIVIFPNDTVQVTHTARRFSVFGAVQQSGRIGLDTATPSLSDLLAEVGGLNDMQAAPNAIFIFRRAQDLESTPTVYRLDFARADSFLLADQFTLHEADIIYVATANAREFHKFIATIVSPFLGGVANAQALGN
jgi:polysaccharide export outer membrane protein